MIGLDYAGKTTLLERLKTKYGKVPGIPPDKIPPTIGMNLARLFYEGMQVIMWDLGGQLKMRSLWEKYYDEAHAIVFLVDATDVQRLEEARLAYGMSRAFAAIYLDIVRNCYSHVQRRSVTMTN